MFFLTGRPDCMVLYWERGKSFRQEAGVSGTFYKIMQFFCNTFYGANVIKRKGKQKAAGKADETTEESMIEELYERFQKELTAWCRGMTRDEALAEDLVQEAFLRAMKNEAVLETLNQNQRRAWLYRTVKNLFIDWFRRSNCEILQDAIPDRMEENEAYSEIDYDLLIQLLPKEESVLFELRYLQGYTSREIGKMFEMPEGTVRARLARARKHLREELNGKRL